MIALRLLSALLPALLVICAWPVQARPPATLEPVQVHARALNAADDHLGSTGTVRVIERETFAHRITTLADTLRDQPGMQLRESGGLGSASTLTLRGASGRQLPVFLDGMLLNDPLYGGFDATQISLHDIGRIHIYAGQAPARYPQAGIGGAIALESLDTADAERLRVRLGGGSFGTRRAGLFTGGQQDRLGYWLSLNHQAADNDFPFDNHADWFNPNDGARTRRRNADVRQDDASARLNLARDNGDSIDLLWQWSDKDQGVPSIQNWANNRARLTRTQQRAQLQYRGQQPFAGRLHHSHRLLVAQFDEHYVDRTGRVGTGTYDVATDTDQIGLHNALSWLQGGHIFSAALDLQHYDQFQDNRLQPERSGQRERRVLASALSHEWHSDDVRWQTQAVLRHTALQDDADDVGTDGNASRERVTGTYHGWHLGSRYALTPALSVQTNVSRQARLPTLVERFGQQGSFIGNPNLEAEEALNTEIGVTLDGSRYRAALTGFHRDLSPAIVTIYDARGVGRYINSEGRLVGIEAEARLDVTCRWSLDMHGTWLDSESRSANIPDRDGRKLPGLYHRSARAGSHWRIGAFELALLGRYDGELYYDSVNALRADGRVLMDARLGWLPRWQHASRLRLDLEVRNISDRRYQDFNRFPGVGRAALVTLDIAL